MKWVRLIFGLCLVLHSCKAPTTSPPKDAKLEGETVTPPPPKKAKNEPDPDFYTKWKTWKASKGPPLTPEDAVPFLGHGGPYGSVGGEASRINLIESDHAPHYSILDYVDLETLRRLPEKMKTLIQERKKLEDELKANGYYKNIEEIEKMEERKHVLDALLNKPIPENQWSEKLHSKELYDEFKKNEQEAKKVTAKIKTLEKKLKAKPSGDTKLEEEIANSKKVEKDLLEKNVKVREEAEAKIRTPALKDEFKELEKQLEKLREKNKELTGERDTHNRKIKNAMGALSIPYEKHRIFPSTGHSGIPDNVKALKTADATTAMKLRDHYERTWQEHIAAGFKKKWIKDAEKYEYFRDQKKVYDFDAIWKHNFDRVIAAAQKERVETKKGKLTPRAKPKGKKSEAETKEGKPTPKAKRKGQKSKAETPPTEEEQEQNFLKVAVELYAKKFMTTAIHFLKTPDAGYFRLINLYIDEYKLYLKNDFDKYKLGISNLLKANQQFGWIKDTDVKQLMRQHNLPDIEMMDTSVAGAPEWANDWNVVEAKIKAKTKKADDKKAENTPAAPSSTVTGAGTVCSTSLTRKKRSTESARDCIFYSRQNEDPNTENALRSEFEEDGLPKPKIRLPSDTDTVSIDSKRLTRYLDDLNGDDIHSVRTKQAVVEYTSRHADKLSGSFEDIAEAKARLEQEDLDLHSEKIVLGTKLLRESAGDINASPKALTKYKQMKISSSKMANSLSKFTKATNKFSSPYGKIMLAKGVVTALRQGDYESLEMVGGRVGLEFALSGVTEMGNLIARKATTKFMTKFGSEFLGKLAGPVGGVADVGNNIYAITKSVTLLNDPNASKFARNDAISDIVVDSIDIAVTATAAILSLAFPPLAPVFAAAAFLVNLLTTIVVGFYKAANNVDRINAELPLLDFEKRQEYWRYVEGRDTSAYIQELIETKAANNIAVNTSVQFLKNNPDYIGRVFPSRTLHQRDAPCWVDLRKCVQINNWVPSCENWNKVSDCDGIGGSCRGTYEGTKCSLANLGNWFASSGYESYEHRCVCGLQPPPQWGYEIPDNEVNFRFKQNVHLMRAAPDFLVPSDFTYLCKPSTLTNEGERVSRPEMEWAYHCKNAIGIKRSNNAGKFMLYDLGNGTDFVHLDTSETVDNLFVVNDGHKEYEGNAGDDTFLIDGPCDQLSGWLDGKGFTEHGNSIVLGENCKPSEKIAIDLRAGIFPVDGKNLVLRSIQRVIGRRGKPDIIQADCDTKLVVGAGGESPSNPDQIYLPSSCDNDTDITVAVEGSSTLHATSFSGGDCFILLQESGHSLLAKIPSSIENGTLVFKFQENVGKLTHVSHGNGAPIELRFEGGGTATFQVSEIGGQKKTTACQDRSEENPVQILIQETRNSSRQLSFSLEPHGRLQATHIIKYCEGAELRIKGYDFMDNVFILKTIGFIGSIDGTASGQNTLKLQLHDDLASNAVVIDFNDGEVTSSDGNFQLQNIQRLVGQEDHVEIVVVSCNVQYLELGGSDAPDIVTIPNSDCSPKVRISVKGKLTIEDRKSSGVTVIEAGYSDRCSSSSRFREMLDLNIGNHGGGDSVLLLNYPISALIAASSSLLHVKWPGGGYVRINGSFPNVYFEAGYNTKSALLSDDSGKLVAYHELNVSDSFLHPQKIRRGTNVSPNVFKLENGKNWIVEGGSQGNVFSLVSSQFSGSVYGNGGRNQLVIGDNIQGDVKVKGTLLFLEGNATLRFREIQEIHGRTGQSEAVELGCEISLLALNGGNVQMPDQIIIPVSIARCDSNLSLTVVAMGYTQLYNFAVTSGKVDTYLVTDPSNNINFKANIWVSPNLILNFPIQVPCFKLSSYEVNIRRVKESNNIESLELKINLMENENFLEFNFKGGFHPKNTNLMFVNEDYSSNGNIFIDTNSNEIFVLHTLQGNESGQQARASRQGAIGAKNIFRLHNGVWDVHGGSLDDSFILNDIGFQGQIHGLQGVNSLILADIIETSVVDINLSEGNLKLDRNFSSSLSVKSIQIVGGRKWKKEIVHGACDTKLIMLEGGVNAYGDQDQIYINDQPCLVEMETIVVLKDFTVVHNSAKKGNFTYHVNVSQSLGWDIEYVATAETSHTLKLEMDLENVTGVRLTSLRNETQLFEINFIDGANKMFHLNFQRLPTVHIGTGPELMAEVLFPGENMTESCLSSSIVARTPFSRSILGLSGVENGIVVKTANSVRGIFGGEKDDNIFLSEVESVLVINGRGGINRLQLSDELHRGHGMEVNFQYEEIKFTETRSDFVTVLKGIELFVGREHSFERVVVGCTTKSVKWADVVSIRNWACGYNVKIEIGDSTRVMFELPDLNEQNHDFIDDEEGDEDEDEIVSQGGNMTTTMEDSSPTVSEETDDIISENEEENGLIPTYLEPSEFHYHFTSVRSFDIEVESFESLIATRHIFHLDFAIANLTSIRFSQNDSRLIYRTFHDPALEYSHLFGEVDEFSMFYTQPEIMTKEGFLLRITRYGEVMAVLAIPDEFLAIDWIQNQIIPVLISQSERLGISFMVEARAQFIYTGSSLQEEVDILTNRLNTTSHLIGWNGTTYEILDMVKDTWIYPQETEVQDVMHVLDLSSIVSHVRNETDSKYVPEVRANGTHLEIVMTNFTEKYPASVVIANGTENAKALVILLKSIAMEIIQDDDTLEWKIKPKPISVPKGHTYVLSPEDLEDGVQINVWVNDGSNEYITYSQKDSDLVITSIANTKEGQGRYTSFVMFDHYEPSSGHPDENSRIGTGSTTVRWKHSMRDVIVNVGRESVHLFSNVHILRKGSGEHIHVDLYDNFLHRMEGEILKDFPHIPRRFNISAISGN